MLKAEHCHYCAERDGAGSATSSWAAKVGVLHRGNHPELPRSVLCAARHCANNQRTNEDNCGYFTATMFQCKSNNRCPTNFEPSDADTRASNTNQHKPSYAGETQQPARPPHFLVKHMAIRRPRPRLTKERLRQRTTYTATNNHGEQSRPRRRPRPRTTTTNNERRTTNDERGTTDHDERPRLRTTTNTNTTNDYNNERPRRTNDYGNEQPRRTNDCGNDNERPQR